MMRYKLLLIYFCLSIIYACKKDNPDHILISHNPYQDEPPIHPFIADSPWPISHRNTYAQASSPLPGPVLVTGMMTKDFQPLLPGLITLAISSKYPDESQIIWGNTIGTVFKAIDDGNKFKVIASYSKPDVTFPDLFSVDNAVSGAYTLVDKDNVFYVPKGYVLYAYTDKIINDATSPIILKYSFEIPTSFWNIDERIVGLTMTYDGKIVLATNHGWIGILERNLSLIDAYILPEDEEISNSIACDEDGGIYIVSSKRMYRVQWTGTILSTEESDGGWISSYEYGGLASGIRLGEGSGSTPTLMGIDGQDKFVIITDGQDLMHIVLFWRDKIPEDWEQISGTKSRRIAAQVPVTFGNPNVQKSLSEQSVCVRGYGALVVNNLLKNNTGVRLIDLLASGIPSNAPYGAEKFVWNPANRTLSTQWVNRQVSFPNGIPCMSSSTQLIYNIGQKNGIWTFDGLDWNTGQLSFQYNLGKNINYNSAYAPTEIGINGAIYSGTLLGMVGLWNP